MNLSLLSAEHRYVLETIQKHADPYINLRVLLSFVQTSIDEPENPFEKRWLINKVRDAVLDLQELNLIDVTEEGARLLGAGEG